MDNVLLSTIVFIGMVLLFSAAFFSSQYNLIAANINQTGSLYNSTTTNLTILGGPSAQFLNAVPICKFTGLVPIITDLIDGGVCVGQWVAWFFGFMFLNSDIAWLGFILLGVSAVVGYKIIRIIRGGG